MILAPLTPSLFDARLRLVIAPLTSVPKVIMNTYAHDDETNMHMNK
jgi:hypothetical protein